MYQQQCSQTLHTKKKKKKKKFRPNNENVRHKRKQIKKFLPHQRKKEKERACKEKKVVKAYESVHACTTWTK